MAYDIKQILQSIPTIGIPNPAQMQRQQDIAKYLALNSSFKYNKTQDKPADRDSSGPSVLSRIFDILSRPNYAIANMTKEAGPRIQKDVKEGDILGALYEAVTLSPLNIINPTNIGTAWEGFSGRKKTTFADVIQDTAGADKEINPIAKYGGGLVLDIAFDPTTYIGAGAIRGAIGAVKNVAGKGDDAAKILKEAPKADGIITKVEYPQLVPDAARPGHFNLTTTKALKPDEVLELRATGLDVSPTIPKTEIKYSAGILENLPEGLAQGKRLNRKQITEQLITELSAKSPRRKPDSIKREAELLVASLLPKIKSPKFRKISEDLENLRAARQPDIATFKITPVASAGGAETSIDKSRLILDELGPLGNSEAANAAKLAQDYIDKTLSKPNKFAKGSKPPAVNNPAQQANFFEKLRSLERQTGGKLNAFKMLRAAEEYMIERGFAPKFWDGSDARLSDVIIELAQDGADVKRVSSALGTQIITAFKNKDASKIKDPHIQQAINNIIANNAEKAAPVVDSILTDALQQSKQAEPFLSQPKLRDFNKAITDDLKKQSGTKYLYSPTLEAAHKLAQDLLGTGPRSPIGPKITQMQRYTENDGKVRWVDIQEAQTKVVEDAIGISEKKAGTIIGDGNKAVEAFMSRFATWWGQKDLRPMVLAKSLTATNNASARARIYNNLHKKYSPEQLAHGFKVAQGQTISDGTPEATEVADFFTKALENLFGSTGLSKEAIAAETVAGRSGMLISDINRQLELAHSDFRFTNGRIMDDQGKIHDYSQGSDWLNSWRSYNVKDPIEFMFRLETAVEQLMHKYAFMDEIAARWGVKVPTGEFNTPLNIKKDPPKDVRLPEGYQRVSKTGKPLKTTYKERPHRLDGVYFPKELVPQIERALATWDQIYNPQSELIKFLDKVTRAWKSGVTIYAPSHHIRNFIGDVYLSWMAGVNNPRVYSKAAKVLFSQKNRYTDLENVENLVGRNAVANALTKPGDKIIRTRGGHELTAEQIYVAAHNQGLLIYTHAIEDIFGGELFEKFKPFGGKVQGFARKASEHREHFVRLAHFIDALSKSREKNLEKLFFEAGKQVRKWHPDGTDLTDFERKYLRRIFPFYSWTRKAVPLMIESAVVNPGKTVFYPKAMYALQGMMGIESPNRSDPFPLDQLFPDWIKEKGIGPIAAHGMSGLPGLISGLSRSVKSFEGQDSGYTIVNPSNPFIDIVAQFGGMGKPSDPIKGIGEMSTPLFRIPAEVISGQTFSGAPIEANRYVAENVPIVSLLSRITNMGPFGPTERGENEGHFNTEALVNLITALGIRGTGPYEKQAEFEEKERRREKRRNRRDELGGN